MAKSLYSSCVNHPAVEATARCKSCLKPICSACREMGPTGVFCSVACKEKHEQFIARAAKLEQMRKPARLGPRKFFRFVMKIVVLAAVVFLAAAIATGMGYEVPVLGEWVVRAREAAGL